jgi:hypothetical protein
MIAVAENTTLQLDKATTLVVDVVDSMTQIGNVWADITANTEIAKNSLEDW